VQPQREREVTEHEQVTQLAHALLSRGWWLGTAESCTGGLIAATCTGLAGSSQWFERAVVTYSNAAKTQMLGVPATLIEQHGAVSEPVVRAMALGLLERAPVQVALAVSGVAGPGGGSDDKPVGTVWLACAVQGGPCVALKCGWSGDRQAVREAAVSQALAMALEALS
jgi:nicotinamide-nucleotide amidase